MILYDSVGPNPATVRIFAAEKGVTLERVRVNLREGENRRPEYLAKNPWGQLPMLELPDGTRITEITAICEYLDEVGGGRSLIGDTPEARAVTRMWTRRIDLGVLEPMANGFRFSDGLALFQDRIRCLPEAADGLKAIARDNLAKLDAALDDGRAFVCGDEPMLPDVLLLAFMVFAGKIGQGVDPAFANVAGIVTRMGARASAAA